MAKSAAGRKKGSKNRGFFFRKGRGWYANDGGRMYALSDSAGIPLKDPKLSQRIVREAYARWLVESDRQQRAIKRAGVPTDVSLLDVCQAYLANVKATGASQTYKGRSDTLFDLCFGLPPRFRNLHREDGKHFSKEQKKLMAKERIHPGYGQMLVTEFLPLHVNEWLNAHPSWKGGRRSRIQAIKRALNYSKEVGLIEQNPIFGYKTPKAINRITYLTPKQEKLLCEEANPQMALAIQVCIRTGARPGCEFAALTARHIRIREQGDRMEWTFQESESKTKRLRILRISDKAIIDIVQEQLKMQPKGPVFRNTLGKPWNRTSLSLGFRNVKKRVEEQQGIEFDSDACMYSCRHTYAKRTLDGYWKGKVTNIETLAGLMGNSPQVCRTHYLQWSDVDNERFWDAS